MQINAFTLQLFAAGIVSEASIHFEPAFHVTRQRVGDQQEQELANQWLILVAAKMRATQVRNKRPIIGCEQKFAPFYDPAVMLPLSRAKHLALKV